MPSASDSSASTGGPSGVAGRINYAQWDKVATKLVDETAKEEEEEIAAQKAALGLDGKYARSRAEAEEREKLKAVKETKKTLEKYKQREMAIVQDLSGLLGPVNDGEGRTSSGDGPKIVRITRDRMDAGSRVVTLNDTSGKSDNNNQDTIVLTQDLSLLESKMPANAATAKSYPGDAENAVLEPTEQQQDRSIFGVIKVFLTNVHNCTVLIKCKIITGTVEIHNCSNVVVRVESTGTVATVQADLSENVTIEFRDAPSGKNTGLPGSQKLYWGDDRDDRIFHAGVKNMRVAIVRDGVVDTEIVSDYLKDGAVPVGNATPEEFQFVTSVVKGELATEKVMRSGSTTGTNARAMTQRELDEEKSLREKAASMAIQMAEDMIQIKDKDGNVLAKKETPASEAETVTDCGDDGDVEEVYASMGADEVKLVVAECEQNKARGNEAFGTGEYGQAILLYSLALDKAEELPDAGTGAAASTEKQLFPRDVVYSNRAACFLKLGQHEKAEEDAARALEINPKNIKANFRRGLALHAMGRYRDALPVLAKAHDIEPKNKQIKQALQFCEVRLAQEERSRLS